MNIRKWGKLAVLLFAVVVMAAAVPFTLGYIFRETAPLVNTFRPPAGLQDEVVVEIAITKQVKNTGEAELSPKGFTFHLKDEYGQVLTAVSDETGAALMTLGYNGAQSGTTFRYILTEQAGNHPGVTYSTVKYLLDVEVYLDAGEAKTRLYVNGAPVDAFAPVFVNQYTAPEIPDTGDPVHVVVLAVLLVVSCGLLIYLWKSRRFRTGEK